jgi:RNA polymerase sigma-70 factor (ECF subfamily)
MLRYSPTMLRLATVITGSRESAREVVQDVFVRLWLHRKDLDIQGDLQRYLWAATRNQARNTVRYEGVRERTVEMLRGLAVYTPRVTFNPAFDVLEAEELLTKLESLLAELPRRCEEIFLLYWRDGMHVEEIAEVLGVGRRTVQNQIARALRHLAGHWTS